MLEFYEFSLSDYDCLYVYDGASTSSPVLGTFMGNSLPPRIETTGQVITLFFTSNGEGVSSGWAAGLSCKPCFTVSSALGSPCDGVSLHPFCTDDTPDGISYPSGTGGYPTVFFGQSSVGCLGNIDKPAAWYYMRISEPGNLLIYLQQFRDSDGSESDVDFACWGPFAASTSADFKNNLCCGRYDFYTESTSTHRPTNGDHANGNFGGYPVDNMIDCSYHSAGTEWCFIPDAQEGEFYLLLITNFASVPGVISFNAVETNYTTAETDCSVLSLAGSNSPVCEGDILFLYCANSESGSTVYWEGPNGFTSTERAPTIYDAMPADSGNYTLYLFLADGDTVVTTIPVVVNSLPNVSVYAYRDTLCANDTTRLVASGADSYRWNTTEIDTSTILVAPTTSTYFQVVGSANGCGSAVGVYVHIYPSVETVVTQFPDPFCHFEINHTIAAQVTSGTPPYSYQWNGNAAAIAGDPASAQTNISAAYLCDSLVEVYLAVTDANNCMKRDTITILIQDIEPPTIETTVYSAEAICQNGQYSIPDITELFDTAAYDNCVSSDEITFSQTPAVGTIITEETDVIVSVHDQCNTLEIGIVEITIPDPIMVSIVKITHATCNKDNGSIEINISTSSDHYDVYWNGIENYTDRTAFNLRPGNYTISVDDGICPIDFPFTINNIQDIKACITVSPSPPNFINDMLRFVDCSQNATYWRWNFGDGNGSSTQYPEHRYDEIGQYEVSLYVRDDNDCEDSTTLTLDIKDKTSFFVPSAFSPNGDGLNDLFKPEFVTIDMTEFKMSIYDRWGTLIFYTENPDSGWNGTGNGKHTLNGAMFVYIIHYRDHFGKRHTVKGEVTVVR
ncbi:MAG: gliding motility-associated C-terminal domain-containing protein [Bacteroidales bacterium]|nr:gliding motility-associated C-terminal domain-containing protein [Bacteroidales bacterium]